MTLLAALTDRRFMSMNIVNQLFDLAQVPAEVRQDINDQADDFVFTLLSKAANWTGAGLIAAERHRQVEVEGWSAEHDDRHDTAELMEGAIAYVVATMGMVVEDNLGSALPVPPMWPWGAASWKPSDDPTRNLVKAGALIAAEIDRLQRLGERGER